MHFTIERLINGDTTLPLNYTTAVKKWREILANVNATDPSAIAALASQNQMWFEKHCGGSWEGLEVMAWAGICMYYTNTTGFGDNIDAARAMYNGLVSSNCSMEIERHARDVAQLYKQLTEA